MKECNRHETGAEGEPQEPNNQAQWTHDPTRPDPKTKMPVRTI